MLSVYRNEIKSYPATPFLYQSLHYNNIQLCNDVRFSISGYAVCIVAVLCMHDYAQRIFSRSAGFP